MPAPMINRTIPVASFTPNPASGATTPPKHTPAIDGMAARSLSLKVQPPFRVCPLD